MEVAAIIQLFPPKTNIPATELNTKQLSSKWTSKHEIAVVQPSKWIKLKRTNTSGSELNAKQSRVLNLETWVFGNLKGRLGPPCWSRDVFGSMDVGWVPVLVT